MEIGEQPRRVLVGQVVTRFASLTLICFSNLVINNSTQTVVIEEKRKEG